LNTKSYVLTFLEAILYIWPFFGHIRLFLELDVESTKNINFEIPDPWWHFSFIFACLTLEQTPGNLRQKSGNRIFSVENEFLYIRLRGSKKGKRWDHLCKGLPQHFLIILQWKDYRSSMTFINFTENYL
jgi:hypothetical protein